MTRLRAILPAALLLLAACTNAPAPSDEAHLLALGEEQYALDWRDRVQAASVAYRDPAAAVAAGYMSIEDTSVGPFEHYARWDWVEDDVLMDPSRPEMLVYQLDDSGARTLVAYAFMLPGRYTFGTVPDLGGGTGTWHLHTGACLRGDPFKNPADGVVLPILVDADGSCSIGYHWPLNLMTHAWVTPNECGPFDVARDPDGQAPPEVVSGVDHTGHIPPCDKELARRVWPDAFD